MKRLGITIALVGIAIIGIGVIVASLALPPMDPAPKRKTAEGRELPSCPVGGQPINFAVRTSTSDGPVFFCCANCIKKFDAEPKKYADKVGDQRMVLAQFPRVQVTCPVSGESVKSDVFVENKGNKVLFCCENCRDSYEKDAAKYAGKLANSYTYQIKCPVTGKPIDPTISSRAPAGETVFFCCKHCPAKFSKEPEKFAPKLEEQGFHFDLSKKKP